VSRVAYIYTLSNPTNSEIFYVGATYNLDVRLRQHLNDATYYSRKKLTAYLNSMNVKPKIEVIDEVVVSSKKESLPTETYWIDQLRTWGFSLTNNQYNLCK
jgi:predicted GIY-YIG superfamily endonuclease